jgi:membrane protease YdiL (CAAX protease family)
MLKALFILIVGSLSTAALLTPWVYELIRSSLGKELPWPYSRVFDRVAMVCVLAFLLLLRRHFSLKDAIDALRAEHRMQALKHIGVGICITLGSVSLAVPLLIYWTGEVIWNPEPAATILKKVFKIFSAALLISAIEECFFRVILLNKFLKHMSSALAVFCCSLVYASVHFIAPIKSWRYETFSWDVGFTYMGQVAGQFLHPTVPSSMFGLMLVGVVLGWVMLRYRSLYLCMGMHAGWVIGVKGVKLIGDFNPALGIPSGRISQYFLVSLPIAWCSILLVLVAFFLFRPRRSAVASEA